MRFYVCAFLLVFLGFILGFFTAAILACASRADKEEK